VIWDLASVGRFVFMMIYSKKLRRILSSRIVGVIEAYFRCHGRELLEMLYGLTWDLVVRSCLSVCFVHNKVYFRLLDTD